jgi:tetratricopeptide (TPR) repeat protein
VTRRKVRERRKDQTALRPLRTSRFSVCVLSVFATAAIVRLIVAASLWDLPLVRTPKLDSAEYLSWAQRLSSGDWAWPVVAQHGPGYPLFLAVLLLLGGGALKFAIAVQALVGAATATMIAAVGRRLLDDERSGIFAGLIYALYGPAVYIDATILSEGLLLCLLVAALLVLSSERQELVQVVAAGAAFGAAAIVRPTSLLIPGACCIRLVLRHRAREALTIAVTTLAVMSPVLAKNWSVSRSLSIQGYGGLNAYIGDSPRHDGRATFRLGAGWDTLNAEAPRAGISDPAAQDRYYLAKTWDEIRHEPARFVALLASKTLWLVQSEEARDAHSFYFFTEQSSWLRILPRWTILFPLAAVGVLLLASDRRRERYDLLLWYAAGAAVSVVLLVVGFRYRMPLVPVLAIAGGVAVCRFRLWRADWRAYGVLIAAIGVCHIVSDPRNLNVAEEWALTGSSLITERNLPQAEASYRQAIALDAGSGLAWDGLGLTLYNAGRLTQAREAFTRALAIDSENARAIYHLGLLDEREGRIKAAADGYERARALSPFDAEITANLAAAWRRLATEMGMSGRSRDALDLMRRVVELTPDNGDAWIDVAMLSMDLGDKNAATDALDHARKAGADAGRIAFAANAIER